MSILFAFCFCLGNPAQAQSAQTPQSEFLTLVEQSRPIEVERRGAQVSPLTHASWNRGTIIITGAAASAGAIGGLVIYIENDFDWEGGFDMSPMVLLPFAGALLGGVVGIAISRHIWPAPDDTSAAQFYVAPYLNEDASGLTFSSRF